MQGEKEKKLSKLPRDELGFTKSFDIASFQPQQVRQFYNEYGLVVFDNVVDENQIENTIDDLWSDLQETYGVEFNRNQPSTWKFQAKPANAYGFVNRVPLAGLQICRNRQNPNVYKAFKSLYELSSGKKLEEPLIAIFDRGSAIRPSKDHPEWITKDFYHFDINPWWFTGLVKVERKNWRDYNDYNPEKFVKWVSEGNKVPRFGHTKLAGVLALTDTNQESGGFECSPGFHNRILEWCKKQKYGTDITEDEELVGSFEKVLQRRGSLLIFCRELPHNIYKNLSQKWRFAQYLRMAPESGLGLTAFEKQRRKVCVRRFLPKQLDVDDEISRQIYMLE